MKPAEALPPLPYLELKTKEDVTQFLGVAAGMLMAGGTPAHATAAAALARTALAALGVDDKGNGEGEEARGFTYQMPDGTPVMLRGRDDPGGN